jgi:hypothetical protein
MEVTQMANVKVPIDGRTQFDPSAVMMVNALMGRWPLTAGVETATVGGKWILQNSWPKAPMSSPPSSSGLSSVSPEPDAGPTSTVQAKSIWPNLK